MKTDEKTILITICARGGSKGVKSKNIRPLLGKPLIAHTIELAKKWNKSQTVVVSTDCEKIASVAKQYGARVPFLRPPELANDTAPKLPVLTHALREMERIDGKSFDIIVDLDPTAPIRELSDLDRGLQHFVSTKTEVCFSVVSARKNPYFNMVERNTEGKVVLVKPPIRTFASRQSAPKVFDMNASIYLFQRDFLLSEPSSLWGGNPEIFEMKEDTAFDIDRERDFDIVEALMRIREVRISDSDTSCI